MDTVTVSGGIGCPVGGPYNTVVVSGSGDGAMTLTVTGVIGVGDGTLKITTYYTMIQ